jgi:hypothetical protein
MKNLIVTLLFMSTLQAFANDECGIRASYIDLRGDGLRFGPQSYLSIPRTRPLPDPLSVPGPAGLLTNNREKDCSFSVRSIGNSEINRPQIVAEYSSPAELFTVREKLILLGIELEEGNSTLTFKKWMFRNRLGNECQLELRGKTVSSLRVLLTATWQCGSAAPRELFVDWPWDIRGEIELEWGLLGGLNYIELGPGSVLADVVPASSTLGSLAETGARRGDLIRFRNIYGCRSLALEDRPCFELPAAE